MAHAITRGARDCLNWSHIMSEIIKKIWHLFSKENESTFNLSDLKPEYNSNQEYLNVLKSEINEMLNNSGKTEEQIYEYIERSSVFNQEMEDIYSKLHTYNSFKLLKQS